MLFRGCGKFHREHFNTFRSCGNQSQINLQK